MFYLLKMFFLILLSFSFLSGCAHVFNPKRINLEAEGRFSELERHMESQIKDPSKTSTSKLYHLCLAYQKLKKYGKLFPCLDCLQAQIDTGDISGWMHFGYSHKAAQLRAEAYMELGQYNQAIEQAKLAYDYVLKYDPEQMWKIETLSVYGLACALGGQKERAVEIARMLDSLDTSSWSYEILDRIKRTGLARIYVALEFFKQAYDIAFQKFAFDYSIAKAIAGDKVFLREKIAHNFIKAKCLFEIGQLNKSKLVYEGLLALQQTRDSGTIYWNILFDRGRIASIEGQQDKAIDFFKKAVEVIEQQRSTINTDVSKIGFIGDKQAVYLDLVASLVEMGRDDEAFAYAERGKSRALVDMLASKKHFTSKVGVTQLSALLGELKEAETKAVIQDSRILPEQHALNRGLTLQIKTKISQADPELASLVTVSPQDVDAIQKLLPLDETLVEYYGGRDTLFAFVVNGDRVRGVKLEVMGLQKEIQIFRKHIMLTPDEMRGLIVKTKVVGEPSGDSRFDKLNAVGESLYQKLIHPIEGMFTSKNLTIVPHGTLHYLPFNALYSKGRYLIDRYSLRVLPSASVMKFLKVRREGQAGELIAFGNPDLGDEKYDLPFAEAEALTIAKEQPNSKVLIRKQASETAVKKYGGQFRRVHFATHGTFNPDTPLESGLLLSSDNENDGMLTVGEIYDLNLNADLVTLSACETALGKVANGDDVVGFTRGFLYAGTNSIVSSLWKVDDKATSMLMKEFYRSLNATDKRSALRTAQLKVKDTYNSHPYFWAAFQITGSVQ